MQKDILKTKSLRAIEQKMQDMDQDSLRYRILESAKNFKASWVELGQALYSVWKDKLYKEWGYVKFETYTAKEIGIRKQTAMKLLKSYYFLEKEEPVYLTKNYSETTDAALLPSYEAIDALRLAKNNRELGTQEYRHLRNEIFEKGKDARELKRDLTSLIRERQELTPQEAWKKRRLSTVKRLLGTLRSLNKEAQILKLLPSAIIQETSELIKNIESEINI
ncbi:MAG: hypothetical protein ABIG31_04210 [Candidatus Omnitrophota bacterium]